MMDEKNELTKGTGRQMSGEFLEGTSNVESRKSGTSDDDLRKFLDRFQFFAPEDIARQLSEKVHKAPLCIVEPAKLFEANLNATVKVASLPFTMAYASVTQQRFDRLFIAERIRGLKDVAPGTPPDDERAFKIAQTRFEEEMNSLEGRDGLTSGVINLLKAAHSSEDFRDTASELLRQSVAMIWGAFESLVSGVVINVINANSQISISLTKNEATKKYFPSRGIQIDSLAERNFDLSKVMGEILFTDNHLDRLPMIRDVLQVMLPSELNLHRKLSEEAFWILWQRRHLIVHKRGIVDRAYLAKTPDTQIIGKQLEISSSYLDHSIKLVSDTGSLLIDAVRAMDF